MFKRGISAAYAERCRAGLVAHAVVAFRQSEVNEYRLIVAGTYDDVGGLYVEMVDPFFMDMLQGSGNSAGVVNGAVNGERFALDHVLQGHAIDEIHYKIG